ncbi:hypothetical protein Tco_1405806 [Tanacetum coccineum]
MQLSSPAINLRPFPHMKWSFINDFIMFSHYPFLDSTDVSLLQGLKEKSVNIHGIGMLFDLIKNLYMPFGIPFNPKRYYKDGDCTRMLRTPRDFLRGTPSYTYTKDPVRRLCHRLISYSISGRGQAPEKVTATDLFYLCSIDRGAANVPYLLVKCLFGHAEGRKSGVRLSGGHFFRRHAHHFGLGSDDGLRGLSVVARELPLIDMGKPIKLNICMDIGDDWAWVALGPKRQPDAAANAPRAAEDAHAVDEGAQADPAPLQAPQPPSPPPATGRTMP